MSSKNRQQILKQEPFPQELLRITNEKLLEIREEAFDKYLASKENWGKTKKIGIVVSIVALISTLYNSISDFGSSKIIPLIILLLVIPLLLISFRCSDALFQSSMRVAHIDAALAEKERRSKIIEDC